MGRHASATRFGRLARRLWDGLLDHEQCRSDEPNATASRRRSIRAGRCRGPGVTVLEASAGTGKTFTIAALTARFVAEGVPIDEHPRRDLHPHGHRRAAGPGPGPAGLGRGQPRPLRRCRRASAVRRSGGRLLAAGPPEEVRARRTRLADALAVFDAATITTTHGFCQLVLAGLGVAGRVGAGATLIEDASDTVDEVVDDLFLRRVLGWGVPPFDRRTAHEIARAAVANPVTPARARRRR